MSPDKNIIEIDGEKIAQKADPNKRKTNPKPSKDSKNTADKENSLAKKDNTAKVSKPKVHKTVKAELESENLSSDLTVNLNADLEVPAPKQVPKPVPKLAHKKVQKAAPKAAPKAALKKEAKVAVLENNEPKTEELSLKKPEKAKVLPKAKAKTQPKAQLKNHTEAKIDAHTKNHAEAKIEEKLEAVEHINELNDLVSPKITVEIVPSPEQDTEPKAKGTGLSRSARRRRAKRIKKMAQIEGETQTSLESDDDEFDDNDADDVNNVDDAGINIERPELLSIGTRKEEQLPALLDENLVQPKNLAKFPKKSKRPKKNEVVLEEEDDENSIKLSGKRKMFVSIQPEEQVEFIITDDGVVSEYFVEMHHQVKLRGNIYKAVISNIDNNLQAAFVNFGGEKNGFLQIDEVHKEYWLCNHNSTKGHKYPPINKALKVGQELLVQIVKEPIGNKGAFLTTWISLPGRYIVLTPGQEQVGISRKVEDQEERQRLKNLLTGIEPGENLGVILRTACVGASKTNIQKDLQFLKRLWKDIQKRAKDDQTPALIYKEADLAYRTLRDYLTDEVCELWTDNEESADALRETVSLIYPRKTTLINIHKDPRQSLSERFNLQRQLEEVFSREVALKSGGRIVFDQTEALMAVDVNSAKTISKTSFEAMVFKTNMEAAEAVARHLRLRDIGGQVVIDFIEMRDKKNCLEVEKTIKSAMKSDRARYDIGKISSFGLMELIRQRTGSSAISISSEPCPHCFGTGVRRNMEWQAQESLREIARRLRSGQGAKYQYETTMELCLYLLNNKRERLTELENLYQCQLELRPMGIGN